MTAAGASVSSATLNYFIYNEATFGKFIDELFGKNSVLLQWPSNVTFIDWLKFTYIKKLNIKLDGNKRNSDLNIIFSFIGNNSTLKAI